MDVLLEKATRQHTKDHNIRLVLRTIYDAGEISRADLARLTRLTRTTVSDVVAELIEQRLVEEVGQGRASVGRTPTLLRVVDDARSIIVVDITAHELQGALVNLRGTIQRRARLPLPGRDGAAVLALLLPLIDSLVKTADGALLGIGISSPGLIDTTSGTVRRAVHFDWRDLPLRSLVQERHKLPVYVANDSHMLALAEYMFGESQSSNLVALKIGQGIGAGIVLNGQLFASDSFGAGEVGHVVVDRDGPPCPCGNRGCLEMVANTAALVGRAQTAAQRNPHSLLHRFAAHSTAVDLDAVLQAFAAGDEEMRRLVVDLGGHLAIAVANLIAILGIQRIVITGRIAPFGDTLRDAVRDEVARLVLPDLARATEIVVLPPHSDRVLLGAAALLLTNELGLARLARRSEEPKPTQ